MFGFAAERSAEGYRLTTGHLDFRPQQEHMKAKPACLKYFSAAMFLIFASWAFAQGKQAGCEALPDHASLRSAVQAVVKEGKKGNGGMGNHEWAALVNRNGIVCAVVFSGNQASDQWPASRLISAEKANTANGLSGPNFALSTANDYYPSLPGKSLYSITGSAPPNPNAAFGDPNSYGQPNDPMVGKQIGGVITFGGGLPLYDPKGKLVGGLGLSGDTSCADHVIAWKVRHQLKLDGVPMGVAPDQTDNMILDIQPNGVSPSGFGHPTCKGGQPSDEIIKNLSKQFPPSPRR